MKTFKDHIIEAKAKTWPGGTASASNWKKVTSAQYEKAKAQHPKPSLNLSGHAESKGRIHAQRFDDGSIGHQHWTDGSKTPSTYKIKHSDGVISHWVKNTVNEEAITEAKEKSLHDILTKDHNFKHKEVHTQGWRPKDAKGDDHYETSEMIEPHETHKILTKAGYTHLRKSKADSRVALPQYTHYEKEQMGSRHSVTVHHALGGEEISHITAKYHRTSD